MAITSFLPEEIMIEILLKLPVKSILRCETLSKHYYSLIRSQFFISRHLLTNKLDNDLAILCPGSGFLSLIDNKGHAMVLESSPSFVGVRTTGRDHKISSPVDGLYCVIHRRNVLIGRGIALWNPSTREEFILPNLPEVTFQKSYCFSQTYAVFGFGYDHNTDDYKVLIFYGSYIIRSCNALEFFTKLSYIFSVNERTWRNLGECDGFNPWIIKPDSRRGVFFRGACHWVYAPSQRVFALGNHSSCRIVAFDLLLETHSYISFPSVGDNYAWCLATIVTLNGCFSLIKPEGGNQRGSSSFDVWVMGEYGNTETWKILYQVSLSSGFVGKFLGIVRTSFFVGDSTVLVLYNLETNKEEPYGNLDKNIGDFLPYEKSLVRIFGRGQVARVGFRHE